MKLLTLTTIVALTGLAAAQISKIPTCALACFQKAIEKTDCGLNYYCQCTSGSKVIQSSVIKCLCDTNACSAAELTRTSMELSTNTWSIADLNTELQNASNKVCSSALAASSQTYSAATIPPNACATGGGSTGTGTASSATTTGTGTAATAASSSAASSSSGTGAAPTNAAMLGYECAAIGLAGMALFGL